MKNTRRFQRSNLHLALMESRWCISFQRVLFLSEEISIDEAKRLYPTLFHPRTQLPRGQTQRHNSGTVVPS